MKYIELQIDDSIYDNFLKMLNLIPQDKIKILEESMTENLMNAKKQALQDLTQDQAISWTDAKKELGL